MTAGDRGRGARSRYRRGAGHGIIPPLALPPAGPAAVTVAPLLAAASLVAASLAAAPLAAPAPEEPGETAGPPPNVLVVFVDDLGWADLGCYGNPFNETPNVDALATRGLKFTDAYAACPVCSPSRAALMTGRDPARVGVTNFIPGHYRPFAALLEPAVPLALPPGEVTFADLLNGDATTASFGKWHLGWDLKTAGPGARGFDEWVVTGGNRDPRFQTPDGNEDRAGEYTAEALTDRTVRFIEDRAGDDKPWVCLLSHFAVHIPIEAPADLVAKYEAKPKADGYPSDPAFAALLESVDRSVGRLRDALEQTGQAENTVVVFTSDNGGLRTHFTGKPVSHGQAGNPVSSNAPLRGEKGSLYEGGIRVPLVVHWPGVADGGRACDAVVTTSDLMPTILELAGAAVPADPPLDGVSLVPVLRGECGAAREAVCWHYPHYHHDVPAGAVRAGGWKLIERYDAGGAAGAELFDLSKDVGETTDLADAEPEKLAELRGLLAAYRAETGAVMPAANPRHDPARAGEWWTRPRPGRPAEPTLPGDYGPPPVEGPHTARGARAASPAGS